MNKTIKHLLIGALLVSANNAGAYTNKTFLQPRNQALVNMPLIRTTWAQRVGAKVEDRFGGNFEVVGFYGQNTNKSDTGKYFGIAEKNDMPLVGTAVGDTVVDFCTGYFLHDNAAASSAVNLKLNPESIHYGVDLAYHQDLSKIVNGLYLKVILPVMHIENDPKFDVVGAGANKSIRATIIDFFKGVYSDATVAQAQSKLEKAKINGKQSATGVADIDVALGYKFLNKETYRMGINIGLSIPTGKESTGEYLFEPTYGTKHFGLGGGLHAGARIWGDEDHNFKISFSANYRYLFQASEKRTLGIVNRNWGQYHLLGTVGGARIGTPAANVLTQNVDITPGSQLDGILGLAYNKGGFNVDLGYNMYFRESESVKLKDAWTETKYGIYARNYAINGADFDAVTNAQKDGNGANFINKANLSTSNASTDSQFTHSIYGGLGYAFKEWEYPLMFGVGGKYEFASKNSALEGWQAWLKAGLSF